jgi:hypothetical protein
VNDAEAQLGRDRANLTDLEQQYADAQQHASTLVEGLATIRPIIDSDTCPVCDRDFGALGEGSLGEHVDQKVRRLSVHGQQLLQLRSRRDDAGKQVATAEANLTKIDLNLLDEGAVADFESRLTELQQLQEALAALAPIIADGDALRERADDAAILVDSLEAAATESAFIDNELNRFATQLNVPSRAADEQQRPSWQRIVDAASSTLDAIDRTDSARREAASSAERLRGALERDRAAASQVLNSAQQASEFTAAIIEGQRRQAVAARTSKQARPAVTFPGARASGVADLEIAVDIRERYPFTFADRQATTRREPLSAGDYGLIVDGQLQATVERKSLADLVSSLTTGRLKFQLTELSAIPRAAVVVEERYPQVFKLDHVRPSVVADGIAECQIRFPTVPIVFCETRKLAQEWTYRFLAAARVGLSEEIVGDLAVRGLEAAPPLAPAPPTPADVRGWATTKNIVVSGRGRIPAAVMDQYLEARARGET